MDEFLVSVQNERQHPSRQMEHFLLPMVHKSCFEWIIVGAETGRRKDKFFPKREWIEKLVDLCKRAEIPIFMKSSLANIWGGSLIQEFPKELGYSDIRRIENPRTRKPISQEERERYLKIAEDSFNDYFGEDFVDEDTEP